MYIPLNILHTVSVQAASCRYAFCKTLPGKIVNGKKYGKYSALVCYAVGKNKTAMIFHYFFADSQPGTCSMQIARCMYLLKKHEHFRFIFLIESDTIVTDTYTEILMIR